MIALLAIHSSVWADQVDMQNGDHYTGRVVALTSDVLTLQNEVLGTIQLPRHKVRMVTFGSAAPALQVPLGGSTNPPAAALTNTPPRVSPALRQLAGNSNLIQRVEAQLLKDAPPEAREKFNELLSGFLTGKLSVSDIRAQAQTAADQVRAVRKDLGEEGAMVDGYLAILDKFLKETASIDPAPAKQRTKPASPEAEE